MSAVIGRQSTGSGQFIQALSLKLDVYLGAPCQTGRHFSSPLIILTHQSGLQMKNDEKAPPSSYCNL